MNATDPLSAYEYELPDSLIAQAPASPRDSSRVLVWDPSSDTETIDTMAHIGKYLPRGCVLVLNDTKVVPARLALKKATGGAVEALFTSLTGNPLKALLPKRVEIGDVLTAPGKLRFTVMGREGREWLLRPEFPRAKLQTALQRHGQAPLPPYIKHSPLTKGQQRQRYQSVFAKNEGSIAAPTASLHFTRRLLAALRKQGVTIVTVTLHVHLGTFLPLTEEQLQNGQLHSEWYSIPDKTIKALKEAKKKEQKIVAVGTTALRTLESASSPNGDIIKPQGTTTLFIREGYRFHLCDGLITNFHVPRSSLLMLVSAFAGAATIRRLYQKAIAKRMRFFSFGDAMFLRRPSSF